MDTIDNPQNIQAGDRVSLLISECPDTVTGGVVRVYRDAIGSLVADVRLPNGEIFPQNVEFLAWVGGEPATYAQTVTRLAREYHHLVDGGEAPPVAYFSLTGRLNAAAVNAGIDRVTSVRDLKDEINAEPVV